MPLMFLEVSLGQFGSLSSITVWRVSPLFKGIGYTITTLTTICSIYYNVILAWAIFFFIKSFSNVLPWSTCDNWWNTPNCVTQHGSDQFNQLQHNETCTELSDTNNNNSPTYSSCPQSNISLNLGMNGSLKRISSSEEYWERYVLQISSGIEEMGSIRWELLGCNAFIWLVIFFCLIKGVRSSGRVYYVTSLFPYVILTILLVRGVTLPGAKEGIKFYIIPKWEKLLTLKVWGEAAMQVFFSMGVGLGTLISLGSYNKFRHNCYRDALMLPVISSCTSLFAGFITFSVIGFMAHETNSSVESVVNQGPGLIFVVYPEAVSRMPVSQVWSVLYFAMIFFVGTGSQMSAVFSVLISLVDEFPILRKKYILVTAIWCLCELLLGIPCVMNGGVYILQILDWYSTPFPMMLVGLSESLTIAWVYGVNKYYHDLEFMLGRKLLIWWKLMWCFVAPGLILFVLSFSIFSHTPVTYGDYSYPTGALVFGWASALVSMLQLPLIIIIKIILAKGTILQRIKSQLKPSPKWGPSLLEHRKLYILSFNDKGSDVSPDLSGKEEFLLNNKK